MRTLLAATLFFCIVAPCARATSGASIAAGDGLAEKIVEREHHVARNLESFHPLVETYIQVMRTHEGEVDPWYDRHFLSLAEFRGGLKALRFKPRDAEIWRYISEYADSLTPLTLEYNPTGFVAMAYPNPGTFDLDHYRFEYRNTVSLGDLRCLVFAVSPTIKDKKGLFEGQIWVEDQNLTIVRFNGIYDGSNISDRYFHFDSWRVKAKPDLWVPAAIYSEEKALPCCGAWKLNWTKIHVRSQTRFWGYGLELLEQDGDSTAVAPRRDSRPRVVPSAFRVEEGIEQRPSEPRQEDDVLRGFERIGLLSPSGNVEQDLQRILASIQVANHLSFPRAVQCRILLTSNLESAAIGNTIVLSRGLLDMLPNEAVLVAVLAHNLAHISVADAGGTDHFSADQAITDPRDVERRIHLGRSPREETQAFALAQQWMQNLSSAYSPDRIREFSAELRDRSPEMTKLLTPIIGESVYQVFVGNHTKPSHFTRGETARAGSFTLGNRISIDPWTDRVSLVGGINDESKPQTGTAVSAGAPLLADVRPAPATNP